MRLDKRLKAIAIALGVVVISFLVSLTAIDWLSSGGAVKAPVITEPPPLPPVARTSFVVAPVVVSLSAIRDAAEQCAKLAHADHSAYRLRINRSDRR